MRLSVEMLRAAYALLETTPPFCDWNLPDADDVRFEVIKDRNKQGDCWFHKEKGFTIRLSSHHHGHLSTVLLTMAHEMVHVHEYKTKLRPTAYKRHGRIFKALAKEVCAHHQFDPLQF